MTVSRNRDKSPENDRDARFHDLRASYTGPIDQDGHKVDNLDQWIDERLHPAGIEIPPTWNGNRRGLTSTGDDE